MTCTSNNELCIEENTNESCHVLPFDQEQGVKNVSMVAAFGKVKFVFSVHVTQVLFFTVVENTSVQKSFFSFEDVMCYV